MSKPPRRHLSRCVPRQLRGSIERFVRNVRVPDVVRPISGRVQLEVVRGLFAVGMLTAGYLLAFVLLLPRIGESVLALTMIPVIAAAWLYGLRGGLVAAVLGVVIDIGLMQTLGDQDGLRASPIPRIAIGLALGAGAGWARDLMRKKDALLIENHDINRALEAAKANLEDQVRPRTAELGA